MSTFVKTIAITILFVTAPLRAAILDFDPMEACGVITCGAGTQVSQDYGDSPLVDVVYSAQRDDRDTSPLTWLTGYNGLENVIYAGDGAGSGPLEIRLIPKLNALITFTGFQFSNFQSRIVNTQWRINDLDGTELATSGGSVQVNGLNSVTGSWSSTSGFLLSLGPDAWNVGFDNIAFSAQPSDINAPSTLLFMLVSLFGFVVVRKRNK